MRVINTNPHGTMDHLAHNAVSATPKRGPNPARPFRLFHSRRDGKTCLECVIHGQQSATLSQADAEARHGKEDCPQCLVNIAKTGDRSKA